MDVVHDRAVGIDISKRDAKVCVRVPGKKLGTFTTSVTTWGSTTGEVLRLREFLEGQHVTVVVMESTSDYWKPFVRHEALCYRVEVRELHRGPVAAGFRS